CYFLKIAWRGSTQSRWCLWYVKWWMPISSSISEVVDTVTLKMDAADVFDGQEFCGQVFKFQVDYKDH
ncbi:Septation ring formation regulator EzrA, partial [Clarias magur]